MVRPGKSNRLKSANNAPAGVVRAGEKRIHMTAKQYLRKVKWNEIKIQERKFQLKSVSGNYIYMQGIDYSRDKVQTSPGDSLSDMVARSLDQQHNLTAKILRNIRAFEEERNLIIDQLQNMEKPEHGTLLFKIYVEHKDLLIAAQEMSYAYQTVANMHGAALQAFEAQYKEYLE